ncbi:hypothetical protein PanWU01x14_313960 [Parasponia andersonii]|uniref:Uncharacterized protein n=1 Tax=Parasponia andersonii TaxID=3476 RepID=A0A2P5ANZ0_PARAD|nr:hypothetical protein PanWU01x14_313960 [Parasponia andersonii]
MLSSIPIYHFSIFKALCSVTEMLEKLMRDFFWEGNEQMGADHLAASDVLCRSKMQGGPGIGKVSARNRALLMKWLWKFPIEMNYLWHNVIKSKYGLSSNQRDMIPAERTT